MPKFLLLILVIFLPQVVLPQPRGESLSDRPVTEVDTTPAFIKTWRLVEDFTTMEDFTFDTAQNTFQIYNPLYRNSISNAYLGNLGLRGQNKLYFNDDPGTGFLFLQSYAPYLYTPEKNMYYNITKPFSMLEYYTSTGMQKEQKEEVFHGIHSQNVNPFINVGFDIKLVSSGGLYKNQQGKLSHFSLFGSRTGKDYTVHSGLHFNGLFAEENGGLQSDSIFMNSNTDEASYEVNLSDARSNTRSLNYQLTQRYRFGRMVEVEDTTSETGFREVRDKTSKTGSFIHTLKLERDYRLYTDDASGQVSGFYPDYFFNTSKTFDSTYFRNLSNTLQIMLDENPNRKNDFGARAFITHEWVRYAYNIRDSVFTATDTTVILSRKHQYGNVSVGASALHTVGTGWSWVFAGQFYPLGYKAGDLILRGKITKMFQGKKGESRIQIAGKMSLLEPDHFLNHYESNHYRWHNDFRKVKDIRGSLLLTNETFSLSAKANLSLVSGYMYFNEQALPAQHNPVISIIGFDVDKKFTLGPFHSDHRLVYHLNTNKDVVRIPDLSYYTSDYFSFYLVKNVLSLEMGFDLYYYTKYRGLAFAPSSGMFYAQEIREIGNYPYLNLFLTAKLKRTRFYLRWDHAYAGMIDKNYFHVLHFPTAGRVMRLGLSWTFYD
jgi:hypothetical protein